jgi:trigger factor
MTVQIEDLSPVEKKLSFVIDADAVQEKLDEAYNTLGKQVQMKGFRPGKVPRRILEKRFGRHIKGEVAGGVISDAFDEAIEEHDITPVSQPVIEQGTLAKGEEFTFSLTVEIKPSIELTGWEGIDVEWETVEVADERVDTELDNLRQRNATVEAAEEGHEVVEGDMVIVEGSFAVEGTDEPRKLDGMMVLAGQATGLPSADWLSDKVLGMKVDDDRAEELTAPDNGIGEEYDGKDGKLEFKVTDIKVRKLPELDDDFAQDIGQDSLEMVKADLRFKLEEHEREHARSHAADNAVKTVIAANPFEVPIGLVRGQAEAMLREQWQ